jgi:hypothetical protein
VGSIDSKKLNAALAKAKDIGLVEEACTISGCDLVLRSLRPEDYTAAIQDCDGLPEAEYVHKYQTGHIARAIVEVNGVNLRDTKFVSVEEHDPETGASKTVKLELHQYLMQHMLDTWGKEAIVVANMKLLEVLELAERRAREGMNFITPDETAEEKYRRLISEARSLEKDLPSTLLDRIMDENGLMLKSTAEEIKLAQQRTDQLAREQEAQAIAAQPAAEAQPEPSKVEAPIAQPLSPKAPASPARPVDPHATLQQAIAARKTLDVPVVKSEQNTDARPSSRAAMIAALEGSSQVAPDVSAAVLLQSGDPNEVVEIKRTPIDVHAANVIVDKPPVSGINPRFKPPQRA